MGRHEGRGKENKGGLERERVRKRYIQRCDRQSKRKE